MASSVALSGSGASEGAASGEDPDSVPLGYGHPPPGQRGGQVIQAIGTGVDADPVPVGEPVERLADAAPVPQQTGAHRQGIAVAHQQGHDPARNHDPRDGVKQRTGVREVHQHALTQDDVEARWGEQLSDRFGLALDQPHPVPDLRRLRRQGRAEVVEQPD